MARKALITGITGQDGSYLADLLLEKGYEVHGLHRRTSTSSTERLDHIPVRPYDADAALTLHSGDMLNGVAMVRLLQEIEPDEVYNLAAQSHVGVSFLEPEMTGEITALGAARLLEAIQASGLADRIRFYQASSSEMFGNAPGPQNEATPLNPCSPYGVAKVYAHQMTRVYREGYGLHAVSGILFNHESPRRGEAFVTRKIARAAARIAAGIEDSLYLGNIDTIRDWGYAPEYVEAMWMMLQADQPTDYVIATGEPCSVRQFATWAFEHVGLDWEEYVRFDGSYARPTEPEALFGDAAKAERELGWAARVLAPELVRLMVDAEVSAIETAAQRVATT